LPGSVNITGREFLPRRRRFKCCCISQPGPRSRPSSNAPRPWSSRSAPTSSTAPPASSAPTGSAIGDWARSLGHHGFTKLYFLNGHGGNVATIDAAFSELYAEASYANRPRGFALRQRNWWDLRGVGQLARSQFPSGHGSHATPSEIAVTQWAYPDAIKHANYAPQIAGSGPIRESSDFRKRHPDGRMGSDPGLATPEKGGELVKLAVAGLIEEVKAFGAETAPE